MKKERSLWFKLSVLVLLIACRLSLSTVVDAATTVCKWKDNKTGAFSMLFDDTLYSHVNFIIPNFISRGLTGTFFVVIAGIRYGYGVMTWESLCSREHIDVENHTMTHNVDMTDDVADYQIGECAKLLWNLWTPGGSRFGFVSAPGSNNWTLTSPKKDEIANKYFIFRPTLEYDQLYLYYFRMQNHPGSALIAQAQMAIDNGSLRIVYGHGVGPQGEYLNQPGPAFLELLDFLVQKKDVLWTGTTKDVVMYDLERQTANVSVIEETSSVIRLNLTSTFPTLPSDPVIYDYPLTLITEVPASWAVGVSSCCKVSQANVNKKSIYPVKVWPSSATVMYEAVPGRGEIRLESAAPDTTPPGTPVIRDGTGADIDTTAEFYQVSANWDACTDAETGIAKYWYKLGTTSGGSEMFDWIDNGTFTYVTTSRTNIALSRGVKYYLTVKAVNGAGLGSTGISNGFTAQFIPGYVKFQDDFEQGSLSKWDNVVQSANNTIAISTEAAYQSSYGIKCHVQGKNDALVRKINLIGMNDTFVKFYFRLSPDFYMPEIFDYREDKLIRLASLYDANMKLVAGFYIVYIKDTEVNSQLVKAFNAYIFLEDDGGLRTFPWDPGNIDIGDNYSGFTYISTATWHCVDIHTKTSDNNKGGFEVWIDGFKMMSYLMRPFSGRDVKHFEIGVSSVGSSVTGDVYFDNITMSDSYYTPDTTPPSAPAVVRDGTSAAADVDNTISRTELSANWDAASDPESLISRYVYAIGTTAGGSDVLNWTDNGTAASVTKTGLSLSEGTKYYFSVKAVNGAGLESAAANSDGQDAGVAEPPVTSTVTATGIAVYPNPYSLSSIQPMKFLVGTGTADGELKIYSVSGKLVRKLAIGAGANNIEWDGRNEENEKVARGIYLYTITEGNGNKKTGKLAVAK